MARKLFLVLALLFLVPTQPAEAGFFGRSNAYYATQGRCAPCGIFRPILRVATFPFRAAFQVALLPFRLVFSPFRARAYAMYGAQPQGYPSYSPTPITHGGAGGGTVVPSRPQAGPTPILGSPTPLHPSGTPVSDGVEEMKKYVAAHSEGALLQEKWKRQNPLLTSSQLALLFAVHEINGKSITGNLDPKLCESRFNQVAEDERGAVKKINTQSWSDSGSSLMAHARACVSRWNGSPKDQRMLMVFHENYCLAMDRNSDGSFECRARFQNRKNTDEI